MSEIDRLYSYKTLFTGRRAVPRHEILSKLEISPATFKRDLAKLRDRLNMPIVFDRDLDGYRLESQINREELPGLWFSHDEALALITIQNMLDQLEPGLLGPKLKPLQKRLDELLGSKGIDAQTLAQRVRLVHAGKRRLHLKSFELTAKATLERHQIKVHHFNRQTGKTSERVLSPQQLIHYRDNWYLDAWCHLKNELRSFSIDALSQCEILPSQAKEMDADEIRKVMQSGYGIFGGHAYEWVKLKFNTERARWVVNEQWHPEQRGTLKPDGSYQLEVPYSDERELIGDILKFGADVEVLSPKSLRSKISQVLHTSAALYSQS